LSTIDPIAAAITYVDQDATLFERFYGPHDVVIRNTQLPLRTPGAKKRVRPDEIYDALRSSRASSRERASPDSHLFVYPQRATKCILGLSRDSIQEVANPVIPISLFGDGA
jgi:hypothetical protein